MSRITTSLILLSAALATSACTLSASSSSEFEESARTMEGIYAVERHVFNTDACSVDNAPAVLGGDQFALARLRQGYGISYFEVVSCASIADCRAKHALGDEGAFEIDFMFQASQAPAPLSLLGNGVSTGFAGAGPMCSGGAVFTTQITLDNRGRLAIDRAIVLADDYPSDGQTCTSDGAIRAAEGKACGQAEFVLAERVADL